MSGTAAGGAEDASAASPLTPELRRAFRWLRFEPALESAYRAEQFRGHVGVLRINLLIVIAIVFAIVQIDHVVMPAVVGAIPNFARYGVLIPTLMIGFALTFVGQAWRWYPRIMSVLSCAALLAIGWLSLWVGTMGQPALYVRLILGTIVVYFVVGLSFRAALTACLLALAFYAWAAAYWSVPALQLVHVLAMLAFTNVICATGAYRLERANRLAWLEARLLFEHALHDGLTGIFNRRRFDDHLERVWQQGMRDRKPVSLLFADLDHFKKYNDRYGHQAGDEALKAVAAVLARHARRPFDLAARFGGEEFAALLYDAPSREASRIADEILADVRALGLVHEDGAAGGILTISIGVATAVPQPKRTAAGLLQHADQALYAAKDGGRDQARALEEEYEHMKTGYFHRRVLQGGGVDGQ